MFVLTIGRYADVTAPALYGRPMNLYWDARHLPNVGAMLAEVATPWMLVASSRRRWPRSSAVIGGALDWAVARVERSLDDASAAPRARCCSRRRSSRLSSLGLRALERGRLLVLRARCTRPMREQRAFVLEARSAIPRGALPDRPLAPSDLGARRRAPTCC